MYNSKNFADRENAIRQGAMHRLYGEGTGSVIDEKYSGSIQGGSSVWPPAALHLIEGRSATTGATISIIKNSIDDPVVFEVMESKYNAVLQLPAVPSPAFVLDKVRTVFCLNISETAEIFGITRQTAYQWMKFGDMEQVRSRKNRDRLKQLYGAAQSWQNFPSLKGRWLHALLPIGKTVFDLLKAPQIDSDTLLGGYRVLAAGTADRQREEGKRTTEAVTALGGAFAGLGGGRKNRKG